MPPVFFQNDTARELFDAEMTKIIHKSASRPTSSKNWGWCSKQCYQNSYRAQRLQEAKVDILTKYACKYLGRAENANPKLEICTGKKKLYPRIETYLLLKESGYSWYERKVSKRVFYIFLLR